MSFDIDPLDKHKRFLLRHNESDSLFEVYSEAEANLYLTECDDVTGVEQFENEFYKLKSGIK